MLLAEKHAADSNTKGVVGKTGMAIPAAPKPRLAKPRVVRRMDFSFMGLVYAGGGGICGGDGSGDAFLGFGWLASRPYRWW